jgi:DNA-binding response OmpR family regulator
MPRMDGFAATQQIRASGPAAGVPIIALTASALETDRERCRAAGMDDFLSKPLHPDALAATLTRWVGSGARNAVPAEAAVEQFGSEEEVLDPDLERSSSSSGRSSSATSSRRSPRRLPPASTGSRPRSWPAR